MRKLGVGVIGTGFAAESLMPSLMATGAIRFVALCGGNDRAKTRSVASRYHVPLVSDDYRTVCEQQGVDLLCVASPHRFHYEMLRFAASNRYSILAEKPLGLTPSQVGVISSIDAGPSRLLLVNHQLRFHPLIARIKSLIDGGLLGTVFHLEISYTSDRHVRNGRTWRWWFDRKEGGGMLLAVGTHLLDLALFLLGDRATPLSFAAGLVPRPLEDLRGRPRKATAESFWHATMKTRSTPLVALSASADSHMPSAFALTLRGSSGEVRLVSPGRLKVSAETKPGRRKDTAIRQCATKDIFREALFHSSAALIRALSNPGACPTNPGFTTFLDYGVISQTMNTLQEGLQTTWPRRHP